MQTSRSSGAVPPRDTDSKKLKRIATMAMPIGVVIILNRRMALYAHRRLI